MTDEYVIQVKPAKSNTNYNYKSRQSFNKLIMYGILESGRFIFY